MDSIQLTSEPGRLPQRVQLDRPRGAVTEPHQGLQYPRSWLAMCSRGGRLERGWPGDWTGSWASAPKASQPGRSPGLAQAGMDCSRTPIRAILLAQLWSLA